MRPRQLTIELINQARQRRTLEHSEALSVFDVIKGHKAGYQWGEGLPGNVASGLLEFDHYRLVEIQDEDSVYALIEWTCKSYESFLMLQPSADDMLTYSSGWVTTPRRVEGAYYVKVSGLDVVKPVSNQMSRTEAARWLEDLKTGCEVEITDHQHHAARIT